MILKHRQRAWNGDPLLLLSCRFLSYDPIPYEAAEIHPHYLESLWQFSRKASFQSWQRRQESKQVFKGECSAGSISPSVSFAFKVYLIKSMTAGCFLSVSYEVSAEANRQRNIEDEQHCVLPKAQVATAHTGGT